MAMAISTSIRVNPQLRVSTAGMQELEQRRERLPGVTRDFIIPQGYNREALLRDRAIMEVVNAAGVII